MNPPSASAFGRSGGSRGGGQLSILQRTTRSPARGHPRLVRAGQCARLPCAGREYLWVAAHLAVGAGAYPARAARPHPVRVFLPEMVRGVYLDLHPGGYVIFSARFDDPLNERIAQTRQLAVVSVDYR
jgi:acetyl esterase